MKSTIREKIAIIRTEIVVAAVVVLVGTSMVLPFRPYDYINNNILNVQDLSDWDFQVENVVSPAESKSTNGTATTSFPIAYLAFARRTFEDQEEPYLLAGDYVSTISISPPNPAENLEQLPFSNDKMKGGLRIFHLMR